ncbi:MAG: hypothetical protein WA902_25140, partial [Thermosynechococcaceae cyanobacterium]
SQSKDLKVPQDREFRGPTQHFCPPASPIDQPLPVRSQNRKDKKTNIEKTLVQAALTLASAP